MSRQKFVIISAKQFGYHTGTYKLAQYLAETFDIIFVCLDSGLQRIEDDSLNVRYVRSSAVPVLRLWRLITISLDTIRQYPSAYIFLIYFPLCFFISLISRRKIILDFRTGSVSPLTLIRKLRDMLATFESTFFSRVSVISNGLASALNIKREKMFILPLGADVISTARKKFDYPRLFYIGTFGNRNLHQVFHGLSAAIDMQPDLRSTISFDVVGFGYKGEESRLKELVCELRLQDIVQFHGRLPHDEASFFFDNSNIGISYVPITSYYDHQPPTKTYEYVLSGMPVIATATSENSRLINSVNGVLCHDTPASFAYSLLECVKKFPEYDSDAIRGTLRDATWHDIAISFKRQLVSGR